MRGVTTEHVGPAGPVTAEEPGAVGVTALKLGGVARVVGDHRAATILLPPPEGGHVVVVAVQEARLAGPGLRRPVRLPGREPVRAVADPARQGRRIAVAQGSAEHVVGEPVDLEQQEAGHVAGRGDAGPSLLAADDVAQPEVAAVKGQQAAHHGGDRGEAEDDDDGGHEPPDVHPRKERVRPQQRQPVEHERPEPERGHGERERDTDQQRPQRRVDQADERSGQECRSRTPNREAPEHCAQQQQGRGVEDEQGGQAQQESIGMHPRRVAPRRVMRLPQVW